MKKEELPMTNNVPISESMIVKTENEILKDDRKHYFQVDFLKAVMIFLVIFDHMVYWDIKEQIGAILWERISIPVFLVIMGFNMGRSFQRKGVQSLKELYSWGYFKNKILRYIVPFLVLYTASTFIGLFMYGFNLSAMYYGQYYPELGLINLFIGFLPFWGPGNWFLPVIFQSILFMPLIYWTFTKNPKLTLILCFVIEFVIYFFLFLFFGTITSYEEAHIVTIIRTSFLIHLSAVGLGMWFSFGHELKSKRNIFMWILFPISLAFIISYQFFNSRIRINGINLLPGDYHFLIFPYSAFLFLLAMKFLPQKSELGISRAITLIGKSTYHILLTQILGYGMITAYWGTHYSIYVGFGPEKILDMIVAWILFISFGILWYKIDQTKDLPRRILYYINFFIIFSSLLFLSFWAQGFWIPIPLLIIVLYAIVALIANFAIRKPLNNKVLFSWSVFLVTTYIMMILQVVVFQSQEFSISLFFISYSLLAAFIGTALWYSRKIY
ncbi:MAG: acyltransferase family protein [Candidatus Thorarchaeota archaeon]